MVWNATPAVPVVQGSGGELEAAVEAERVKGHGAEQAVQVVTVASRLQGTEAARGALVSQRGGGGSWAVTLPVGAPCGGSRFEAGESSGTAASPDATLSHRVREMLAQMGRHVMPADGSSVSTGIAAVEAALITAAVVSCAVADSYMPALSDAQRRQADTERREDMADERLARAEAELLVARQELAEERVRNASLQSEVARLETADAKAESLTIQLEQHQQELADLRVSTRLARSKAQTANEHLRKGLDQARRQEALAVEFFKSSPEYYAALEARA